MSGTLCGEEGEDLSRFGQQNYRAGEDQAAANAEDDSGRSACRLILGVGGSSVLAGGVVRLGGVRPLAGVVLAVVGAWLAIVAHSAGSIFVAQGVALRLAPLVPLLFRRGFVVFVHAHRVGVLLCAGRGVGGVRGVAHSQMVPFCSHSQAVSQILRRGNEAQIRRHWVRLQVGFACLGHSPVSGLESRAG